ncbi:Fe-S cluster assembly sulfur transfer protein SufU [Mobilicoccus massiliensis]|uniref:Fe-S cluster assembly sulfur transfer protein SufU n=1 Tax=Mobilicoccus massiliensis TaxID=1522310 RepID=UPI00058F1394|nr:SUF system NifU family Fe-S cluster assembly protein [Mobilicoccus massiliensis]
MDLYQELILDHSKHPQHAGLRDPFDSEVHHVNTSCGDELTLRVKLAEKDGQQTVEDVSYDAIGCSISVAATSILAEESIGYPVADVLGTYEAMKSMLTSRGQDVGDEEVIGDGVALAGVAQYPARVKCALLGWSALVDAMARAGADISTSDNTAGSGAAPAAGPMEDA